MQEVIAACRKVTGHPIPQSIAPRRAGDPAELVADSSLAQKTLNWKPHYIDIEGIVANSLEVASIHPRGIPVVAGPAGRSQISTLG